MCKTRVEEDLHHLTTPCRSSYTAHMKMLENIAVLTSQQTKTKTKVFGHAEAKPTNKVLPLPNYRSTTPSLPHKPPHTGDVVHVQPQESNLGTH
jgi:hypothetical protein